MKKTIKNIIKKSILYKYYQKKKGADMQKRLDALNVAFKKEGTTVLYEFAKVLNTSNIQYWLMAGTLLGYYREHDFIAHDYDLDTGAWFKDHEKIREALEQNGFKRVKLYYLENEDGMEESYQYKDLVTSIDIFYFMNDEQFSYHYSFQPLVSMTKNKHLNKKQKSLARKWSYPFIKPIPAVFKGINIFVPEETDKHLAFTYGDTFMTPIKDFPVVGRPNLTEYSYEEKPAVTIMSVGY